MVKRWLFIRLCIARAQVAKLREENRMLRDQMLMAITDRNAIIKQYFDYVNKSTRRR